MTEQTHAPMPTGHGPTATLRLTMPSGTPVNITITLETTGEDMKKMVELAEKSDTWLMGRGWGVPEDQDTPPQDDGQARYLGWQCSPVFDALGYPEWIEKTGEMYKRIERDGDVWFSCHTGQDAEGKHTYKRLFTVKKGERPPHQKETE